LKLSVHTNTESLKWFLCVEKYGKITKSPQFWSHSGIPFYTVGCGILKLVASNEIDSLINSNWADALQSSFAEFSIEGFFEKCKRFQGKSLFCTVVLHGFVDLIENKETANLCFQY
jgi:hypothetical protein